MTIKRVQLSTENLQELPENESMFFLALGHISNDVNALTKLMYWAANVSAEEDSPQSHGSMTFNVLLIQLLAGKLFEAWKLFERSFFGAGLSRAYEPLLDAKAAQDLGVLKKYFGRKNAAEHIRNKFAFHYTRADVTPILRRYNSPLYVYLERGTAPNTLFHSSATVFAEALILSLSEANLATTLEALVEDLFTIAATFVRTSDGIADAIIKNNARPLHLTPLAEHEIAPLPGFDAVMIPWFTDTTGKIASLHPEQSLED